MKKISKKICSLVCLLLFVSAFSVPAFAAAEPEMDMEKLQNSDYVTKDVETGEIDYITNQELELTRSVLTDVQPPFEGTAPQEPVIAPRGIIGADDRWRIPDSQMKTFPYRAIGYIITTWPNGARSYGTGWFFKSNAIVTAGHLAYSKDMGGWASKIEVYPGKNGISNPYGGASSTSMGVPTPYVQSKDGTMDYALVRLNLSLGNTVGWFGYSYSHIPLLNRITIAGYPSEKGQTMWAGAGTLTGSTEYNLDYTIDTTAGQSGSPIFDTSDRIAIGVHTAGSSSKNIGKKIHKDMYNWMVSY